LGQPTVKVQSNWTNTVTFGENLKDWRELLRNGENATTTMQGRLSKVRIENGSLFFQLPGGYKIFMGGVVGNFTVAPPGNPDALGETESNAQALGRFATKIVNAHSAVQGGVIVGELRETLSMIRNPARGLRRLVTDWHDIARSIRATRRIGSLARHISQVTEHLADAWLETVFGWKPLLADIDSSCKALAEYTVGSTLDTRRITAKAETRVSGSDTSSIQLSGNAIWQETFRTIGTVQVVYRGAVRLEVRDPKTMDPALFGFSPEQFLPTAWELIPYSFLIDYFVNINDIINGWSSLMVNLKWCNRTVRKTYETTKIASSSKQLSSNLQSCVPAKVIGTNTYVTRAKYNGTTVPDLDFRMPGSDSLRWLNIAALVASRRSDRSWVYD
jgi:hypothetical protein